MPGLFCPAALVARSFGSLRSWVFAIFAVCGLHLAAREVVAGAVALAPNAGLLVGRVESFALPAELAARGARRVQTIIASPRATLVSWVAPAAEAQTKGTILLLHGVRMDKRSLVPLAVALLDDGYRVVLTDLRGHGESSGDYLTYGAVEADDVATVLDSALEREPAGPVGVYGFSYGAVVALELGARDARIQSVVAVAPFSSLRKVVADYEREYLPAPLRLIPDGWFQSAVDEAGRLARFDPDAGSPLALMNGVRQNVLLVHGDADTQIPPYHSRELAQAARGRARLVMLPNESHATISVSQAVRRETLAWFDRNLASQS